MSIQPTAALEVVRTHIALDGRVDNGIERALSRGGNMRTLASAVIELAKEHKISYNAVGARGFTVALWPKPLP